MSKRLAFTNYSYFILPLLWMGVIYYFSAQSTLPGSEVFLLDFIFKKLAHIFVYLVLFFSWFVAFQRNGWAKNLSQKTWLIMLLLCLFYALADEFHQSLVPGRTARLRDVGLDCLGATLAFLWSYRLI